MLSRSPTTYLTEQIEQAEYRNHSFQSFHGDSEQNRWPISGHQAFLCPKYSIQELLLNMHICGESHATKHNTTFFQLNLSS